jgi:hypothetical protein
MAGARGLSPLQNHPLLFAPEPAASRIKLHLAAPAEVACTYTINRRLISPIERLR